MRRLRLALAVALVVAVAALVAGCGGSDPDEAKTPSDAITITNGNPPTDDGEGGGEGGEGDAEAGKTAFEGACQGCHADGGKTAGAGPVLVDRGLAADAIRTQIVEGGTGMPANLVEGADLDNVVAFVSSLQGDSAPAEGGGEAPGEDTASADPGKTFFEGSCQGCHPAGGNEDGVGPKLAGAGLNEEGIRNQIVNGSGSMPAGLATGDDLENVVKYLVSLQ